MLRPSQSGQLLPAAAALTVAGVLIGGAGAAIKLAPQSSPTDLASTYDQADYPPPDREALAGRADRGESRPAVSGSTQDGPATSSDRSAVAADEKPASLGTAAKVISTGACEASYYAEPQGTANGEQFDPQAMTAAHKSLPFNSRVRVTNVANGKSITVRINDRGPFTGDRCLDLSKAAFGSIASLDTGVTDVRFEVLAQDAT